MINIFHSPWGQIFRGAWKDKRIGNRQKITSASRFFRNWSSASMAKASPTPYGGRCSRIMPQSYNCLSGYAQVAWSQYSELTADRTFFCKSSNWNEMTVINQYQMKLCKSTPIYHHQQNINTQTMEQITTNIVTFYFNI